MADKPDKLAVIGIGIALLAIVATVVFNMYMWNGYYQPTLRLLQEQATKKPILILSVYPSSGFSMSESFSGNFTINNSTFEFRPGQNVTFDIFLSNIGSSPTVAEYLLFQWYFVPTRGGGAATILNATILRPGDSHEWRLIFTIPKISKRSDLVVQFAVVTTDAIVKKIIWYDVVPCC